MKWKVILQFLVAVMIIGIAGNIINSAVMTYYFYQSSDLNIAAKMPVSFSPNTLDVKKLMASIGPEELSQQIKPEAEQMLIKSGSWIQIIDNSGKEVKSFNKPEMVISKYNQQELPDLVNQVSKIKDYNIFISNVMGPKRITIQGVVKGPVTDEKGLTNVIYIVGTPKPKLTIATFFYVLFSYFTSGWSEQKVVSTLLTVLLVLILGYIFARKMTKPVVKIVDGIAVLSKGNYNTSFKEHGLYKEVFGSLNNMVQTLKQNEIERKRIEKVREDWIVNISHDLKTPLSSIKGYGELLQEPDYKLTSEEKEKYSEVIINKSNYIEQLLDDLTLTYKLKNELFIDKKEDDLVEILRDVIIHILNDPKYENRKIEFEPQAENIYFNCNKMLLQRAFTNIIFNAIVHNPENTETTVKIAHNDQGITIKIEDNGIGISEEDCKNLFHRYYRGTNTEESYQGSGLGLAIAKEIIEAHSGKITLESKMGEGTKIYLYF
ncbi:MAG: HAMP domain-containing histidine kinase [Clostridia bacterium]|nr:HAMP domain-containing histidine kinase [Clostridia bacterium]